MSSPVAEPPFHLFIAGIVALGMLCVPLLDKTQQGVTQPIDCCTSHFGLIVELSLILLLFDCQITHVLTVSKTTFILLFCRYHFYLVVVYSC